MVEKKDLTNEQITLDAIHLLGKLNDSRLGLDDCQGLFLVALSQIFENEYSILLVTDSEGGTQAIKKFARKGQSDLSEETVDLTSGILHQCYQDLKVIDRSLDSSEGVNLSVDSVDGVAIRSITCAPPAHLPTHERSADCFFHR